MFAFRKAILTLATLADINYIYSPNEHKPRTYFKQCALTAAVGGALHQNDTRFWATYEARLDHDNNEGNKLGFPSLRHYNAVALLLKRNSQNHCI